MAARRSLTLACQDIALAGVLLPPYRAAFTRRPIALAGQPCTYDAVADMVDDGATRWDVCLTDVADTARMGRAGLLEMIDWTVVDRAAAPAALTVPWWGVPAYRYSYVLAYHCAALPGPPPASWSDLWNPALPGQRLVSAASVTGLCEAALLGAGIPPAALYPLDLDHAFARLAQLRAQATFAPDDAACAEALLHGQAGMALLRNTTAHLLHQSSGGRIAVASAPPILAPAQFCVPKQAPTGADAMRFIAAAQGRQLPAALPDLLSPAPGVPIDIAWYLDNLPALQPRWTDFIAG